MADELLDEPLGGDSTSPEDGFVDEVGVPEGEAGGEREAEKPQDEDTLDDFPAKYRGKTAREIAEMHRLAEETVVRQGAELGRLRRQEEEPTRTQETGTPTDPLQERIQREAYEALTLWEDEQKINLRLQGYTPEDASQQVESLRDDRWALEWHKASRVVREQARRELAEQRTQVPGLLNSLVSQVAGEVPQLAGVTAEEVVALLGENPAAMDTFLSSSPAARVQQVQTAMIYAMGLRQVRTNAPLTVTDEDSAPSTAPAVLRRNTASNTANAYRSDPAYRQIVAQQAAWSGLNLSDPEEAKRVHAMALTVYKKTKGGSS